jgi:HEPN domain-containing protein
MAERSVAELLLAAAKRDRQAFQALARIPDMNDAVIGFHAHQSIEKALKAALAHAQIPFRRTHSIAELLDLMEINGRAAPPFLDRLDEFDPFAVEVRYGMIEPARVDREAALGMVEAVLAWAEAQIAKPAEHVLD